LKVKTVKKKLEEKKMGRGRERRNGGKGKG